MSEIPPPPADDRIDATPPTDDPIATSRSTRWGRAGLLAGAGVTVGFSAGLAAAALFDHGGDDPRRIEGPSLGRGSDLDGQPSDGSLGAGRPGSEDRGQTGGRPSEDWGAQPSQPPGGDRSASESTDADGQSPESSGPSRSLGRTEAS